PALVLSPPHAGAKCAHWLDWYIAESKTAVYGPGKRACHTQGSGVSVLYLLAVAKKGPPETYLVWGHGYGSCSALLAPCDHRGLRYIASGYELIFGGGFLDCANLSSCSG